MLWLINQLYSVSQPTRGRSRGFGSRASPTAKTCSSAEAPDEDGNIEQIDVYAKKRTIQCEGNVLKDGDLSALTVGAELTVDGNTFIIDSVTVRESVNAHKTCSISGSAPIPASE